MVEGFLGLRKCPCAEKQILRVLLAILLPRANPFKVTYDFISLHVQAVLLPELPDLASLGETFTPGSFPSLSLQPRQPLAVLAGPPVLVVLSLCPPWGAAEGRGESCEGTFPAFSIIPAPLPHRDLMLLQMWSLLGAQGTQPGTRVFRGDTAWGDGFEGVGLFFLL